MKKTDIHFVQPYRSFSQRSTNQTKYTVCFTYQLRNISFVYARFRIILRKSACAELQNKGRIILLCLDGIFVGLDHLLRRDTRTTSTPCIELFKPFFGAFARKYLNFKLRCIIIC